MKDGHEGDDEDERKKQSELAKNVKAQPKFGMKIMPISKRFYLFSDVVDLKQKSKKQQKDKQ